MTTLIDTPTAVTLSGLSYSSLRRYAQQGRLTSVTSPLSAREVLWVEDQIKALSPSVNTPEPEMGGDIADRVARRFVDIAAEFQEGDRARAQELIAGTPAELVTGLVEFAVTLAFTAIEDEVDAATDTTAGVEDEAVTSESIG